MNAGDAALVAANVKAFQNGKEELWKLQSMTLTS